MTQTYSCKRKAAVEDEMLQHPVFGDHFEDPDKFEDPDSRRQSGKRKQKEEEKNEKQQQK